MHEVVKVKYNGVVKYLTKGAFYLALGQDFSKNTNHLKEIERFKVLNAIDLEKEILAVTE